MIPLRLNAEGQPLVNTPERPTYLPGVLVIKVKPGVVQEVPDLAGKTVAAARSLRLPEAVEEPIAMLRRKGLIEQVVPVFASAPLAMVSAPKLKAHSATAAAATMAVSEQALLDIRIPAVAFTRSVREVGDKDLQGINLLRLSARADLPALQKELDKARGVEYCHRVPARWPARTSVAAGLANPMLNRQWGLRAIHWFEAQPLPDASEVKVAVLDTGVDAKHPDLQRVIAAYHSDGTTDTDIVGHGTHVSGILGANPDDRAGITGASNCKIHLWKVFKDVPYDGEYYADEVLYERALGAVLDSGMRVVNLSLTGTVRNPTEEMLFRKLIDSNVVVVAAMGNDFQKGNPTGYPAAYPSVIAVGATDETDKRASFSNTGSHISLSAPGTNILSTLPSYTSAYRPEQKDYIAWNGTSMATPQVTAAAASVVARNPRFSNRDVTDRLTNTAIKVPAMRGRKNTQELGAGLLDLRSALQ